MAFEAKRIVPVLRMFDEAKAREFYVDFLGFSVDFEHRFAPDLPLFMQVSRAGATLRLSEHHGDGAPGQHLTVIASGVEELQAELAAKKYRYMRPGVVLTEWKTKDVKVFDPFGNVIVFSEPIGDQPA